MRAALTGGLRGAVIVGTRGIRVREVRSCVRLGDGHIVCERKRCARQHCSIRYDCVRLERNEKGRATSSPAV